MPDEGDASDSELVRRLADGDDEVRHAAFTELHRRHSRASFRLAFRVLGDAALAADAVQEAFISVLAKGARFEERARFSSWLFRVVLNRAIDLRRRELRPGGGVLAARRGRGEPGDDGSAPEEAALEPAPGPEDAATDAERADLVRDAIRRLSPKLEEVVLLRYPQGLSYEEIGELLGLPPGTVRSRLNRAHAALREMLGPRLDDFGGNP